MQTLYFRITPRVGTPTYDMGKWFASSPLVKKTPESQLKFLQKRADMQGLGCDYALATVEEYRAYRASITAAIEAAAAAKKGA